PESSSPAGASSRRRALWRLVPRSGLDGTDKKIWYSRGRQTSEGSSPGVSSRLRDVRRTSVLASPSPIQGYRRDGTDQEEQLAATAGVPLRESESGASPGSTGRARSRLLAR